MRDIEQYNNYPCLKYLYIMLGQDENKVGRKRADTIVCFLNRDIRKLKKCNLEKTLKKDMYLMLRREFIRRLEYVMTLNQDNRNSLKGYIIARTKEMRKKIGRNE